MQSTEPQIPQTIRGPLAGVVSDDASASTRGLNLLLRRWAVCVCWFMLQKYCSDLCKEL